MTLVSRNVTFNEIDIGREGEVQLERPTETVVLELGDDAVVVTTDKSTLDEQYLSDTQSQTATHLRLKTRT